MHVFFTHLGCKLNQAEIERMARQFEGAGHQLVDRLEDADLHVINSCTVTHAAARDSRKTARRASRLDLTVRTVLTGCYASGSPEEAAALVGVDLVVDNRNKDELLDQVHEAFPDSVPQATAGGGTGPVPVSYVPLRFHHTRAAVKVEDGCNMRCAFCIIPFTRGSQTSLSPESVIEEITLLTQQGVEEVVITGVQISAYRHRGSGQITTLTDLTRRILAETCVPRLRLTSIAPWQFDDQLLDLWPDERLCRHFHFSLQSGCDETLERMRRPYTTARYAALTEQLRNHIPGVAITTDVIVGFPGETDREFEQSLEFVRSQSYARTHVFPYSEREGTEAIQLGGSVPVPVRKERTRRMIEVGLASERAFAAQHRGTTAQVLWESQHGERMSGTTDNYLRVEGPLAAGQLGRLGEVWLDELDPSRAVLLTGQPAGDGSAPVALGRSLVG